MLPRKRSDLPSRQREEKIDLRQRSRASLVPIGGPARLAAKSCRATARDEGEEGRRGVSGNFLRVPQSLYGRGLGGGLRRAMTEKVLDVGKLSLGLRRQISNGRLFR